MAGAVCCAVLTRQAAASGCTAGLAPADAGEHLRKSLACVSQHAGTGTTATAATAVPI